MKMATQLEQYEGFSELLTDLENGKTRLATASNISRKLIIFHSCKNTCKAKGS